MLFTCSYCGKEFKQSPANRRLAKTFCSRKCYHDSTKQSRDRVCEYCGKTFQVKKQSKQNSVAENACVLNDETVRKMWLLEKMVIGISGYLMVVQKKNT